MESISNKNNRTMNNILMILGSVLLNALAQLLIRKGMLQIGSVGVGNIVESIVPMITNLWLWGAMLSYAVSILMWMSVLSKVEVSYAYPFLSVGYIVAAVAGYALFSENLSITRIAGIIVICIGVILISRS